ncbi:hypothetical protein IAQ61_003182 [Plenodomus lingam]|uniref:uncharacterized protein n=1 Tax=Leptosphaeria maculans TaxID=5022 RepID=UPI00331BA7F6|nr:hypothetical protein IAQ61_003182 [Plenodomus lingam]
MKATRYLTIVLLPVPLVAHLAQPPHQGVGFQCILSLAYTVCAVLLQSPSLSSYSPRPESPMSSTSPSDRPLSKKKVTSKEIIISKNLASGNALQINGDAVDQMWNVHVENVFIIYPIRSATDVASSRLESAHSPSCKSQKSNVDKTYKRLDRTKEGLPASNLKMGTIPTKNIVLYPKLSNNREVVRAIFRPSIPENFIARRIVRRLKMEIDGHSATAKSLILGETTVSSTTTYVDLACSAENSSKRVTHRFYIARRCPFDVLFGSQCIRSVAD